MISGYETTQTSQRKSCIFSCSLIPSALVRGRTAERHVRMSREKRGERSDGRSENERSAEKEREIGER